MKEITCRLKLAADSGWNNRDRVVELTLIEGKSKRQGTWRMVADARDSRMVIGEKSGRWTTDEVSGVWTMYLIGAVDLTILLELYDTGSDPFDQVTCTSSIGGKGWRQGPPPSDVVYGLNFGCI